MVQISPPTTIRPLGPHEWPLWRALRLRALADAPDAFGRTLAAEQQRTSETWAGRLALAASSGRDWPLVAEAEGAPVGLAWAKFDASEPEVVNIFQMWVAPQARGHGTAALLVRECVRWARAGGARALQLGVECGNGAARRLYAREGFVDAGAPVPLREGSGLLEQPMRLAL